MSDEPKKDHLLLQRAHVTTKAKQPSAHCGEACIQACRGNEDCEGECKECPEYMDADGEPVITTTSWLWNYDSESHSTTKWSSNSTFGDANDSSSSNGGWFSGTKSSSGYSSSSSSSSSRAWISSTIGNDLNASNGSNRTSAQPSESTWWKQWFSDNNWSASIGSSTTTAEPSGSNWWMDLFR